MKDMSRPVEPGNIMTNRRDTLLVALAAGMICLLAYLRALSCDFLNFDDHDFVLNNIAIRKLDFNLLRWAFTTIAPISGSWIPLSWISFAIDYHFWGLNPVGFHLTNIVLHAVNTVLVVLIADQLYRSRLAEFGSSLNTKYLYPAMLLLAGLLFGLHPLRVETVAWVTERRGLLNALFSFGAILYYLRYAQKKGACGKVAVNREYFLSLTCLVLSFMAKPASVTIPVMLLVIDWYPLGRLRKESILQVLAEKVPYLILSVTMAVVTFYIGVQEGGLLAKSGDLTLWSRLILSGNAIFEYCRLALYPVGILPLTILTAPIPFAFTVKAGVVAVICFCMYFTRTYRWLPATWLGFLIPLLPVLAFFQTNDVAYAPRYVYIPSLMPSIVAAAVAGIVYAKVRGLERHFPRVLAVCLILALLVFYGAMTQRLIGVWKDSGTMWSRVIEFQPFDRAYFLRGLYYVDSGNYDAAVKDYTTCLDIAVRERLPGIYVTNIHGFRGEAFARAGRFEEAVQDFSVAIGMFAHPLYFYHRGLAYQNLGKIEEAENDFRRAGQSQGQMLWVAK